MLQINEHEQYHGMCFPPRRVGIDHSYLLFYPSRLQLFYFISFITVESTTPPIADLAALVAQLNASNDFSWFVQAVRRRFQQLV